MNVYYLLILTLFFTASCHRKVSAEDAISGTTPKIPLCIQHKIDSIRQLPVWNPPASVELYEYNNQKIYVVSADCCDFFTTAFDEDCNYVCAPSGGFTGKGDGLCKDFNSNAKLIKVVWKDERQKKPKN